LSLSRIRWTSAATTDLESIADYLFEKSPLNAAQLVRKIYEAPLNLKNYPNLGRPGKKSGTRELVLAPLPYIVIYKILDDTMFIVRVLHGAQEWPL
jgi:addiction module RelE/StbE family toxin